MTALPRVLRVTGVFLLGALAVWGLRALVGAPAPAEAPPAAALEASPSAEVARGMDETDASTEPAPLPPDPAPVRTVPAALEPAVSPPPSKAPDVRRLTNEQLWSRGNAGGPDVGIAARVEALEELLRRSQATEERVQTLKALAFQLRASIEPSTLRQVQVLEEAILLAGPESPEGHEAAIQLSWPQWELFRRDQAVETARSVATSPRARPVHRGLADWALLVFALERKELAEAEAHFAALTSIREPALASTQSLARQRIAAARARR